MEHITVMLSAEDFDRAVCGTPEGQPSLPVGPYAVPSALPPSLTSSMPSPSSKAGKTPDASAEENRVILTEKERACRRGCLQATQALSHAVAHICAQGWTDRIDSRALGTKILHEIASWKESLQKHLDDTDAAFLGKYLDRVTQEMKTTRLPTQGDWK